MSTKSAKVDAIVADATARGFAVEVTDVSDDTFDAYTVTIRRYSGEINNMLDLVNASESIWLHALRFKGRAAAFKLSARLHTFGTTNQPLRPSSIPSRLETWSHR